MKRRSPILFAINMLGAATVLANPLAGDKTMSFLTPDGEETVVGQVQFMAEGEASKYRIIWDDAQFTDHFLSMRPFRYMEGPDKNWCYIPYPYENRHQVAADDLTDLEYDLLFLWKKRQRLRHQHAERGLLQTGN